MKKSMNAGFTELTRRDFLKASGGALGGFAVGGIVGCGSHDSVATASTDADPDYGPLVVPPGSDEMRISFLGTWYTPRPNQACNSVFVELGNGDSFVFDCGSGVVSRYVAMGVPYSRMNKVFLTHLHGDHMNDLVTIYCFGPSSDRKSPLHVWGPSGDTEDEGTTFFCQKLKELTKWHRESFSFLPTGYTEGGDGYDLEAHELPYMDNPGVAYDGNGVTITHFPAVHARNGSISYKLEWNGMSMVFTGDTKPNNFVLEHAKGVDVLIHEMTTPPEVWTTKQTGLTEGATYDYVLSLNKEVIENSHTVQRAFGYILGQTSPRLGVATHFPDDPDLIGPAMADIRNFYNGNVIIAQDLLVITVNKNGSISEAYAKVPEYPWYTGKLAGELAPSKYDGPLAQFNDTLISNVIPEEYYE
ncbi:MAG TPA: guanitoxin biosynthesis MBL fold metallo-hydrolase GntH [Syntrophales bacterium]|nr:guanitoxin biosynthesis MBL fold metallo-hydrolase GntH [Syntrophales bacterium]HQB29635.1 guanitoxin biosynthesis MBL fold metallo-hydrolase GntH [Syntrophales bacterium]HQN77440.1 guanitoxin biosynthesis MBL fold metallo-hydrolase GntH [Syntrophales bacterium]HQQ28081.1 guanitoxin biosynthesis MBL fold metallo-hydrolase GntH [Syntrophales bacterium]